MENLTNWCVYMHTNRENGKKYIGITSQKPTRRWQNGLHYNTQPYFWRAIQKYGWDGFQHEILYTELNQERAERLEVELIEKYQTRALDKGYNVAIGGNARSGWNHTEEAKQRMSKSRKGRAVAESTRKKISDANRGRKMSDEAKIKMSIAKKGKPGRIWTEQELQSRSKNWPPEVPANWKPVNQLSITGELLQVFQSQKEAAAAVGIAPNRISECCSGARKTTGGFRWEHANQVVTSSA